jgi:putative transposase
MPRGPRLDAPGALHHVMVRGIEDRPIFRDDRDRDDFTQRLATLAPATGLTIYAWALLPNHAHLLVRTGTRPLARTMRSLLTGYAGAFNRRHHRRGHLFQNRYRSIVVEEEPYFLELVRYLHLNPIRAGVVTDLRGVDRYPYTGHATLMGTMPRLWQATKEVLGRFASDRRRARARYRAFVAAGIPQGHRPELQGGGLIRSAGGWAAVQELRRGREAYTADERVLGTGSFVEDLLREVERQAREETGTLRRQVDLHTLASRMAESLGLSATVMLGKSRVRAAARARQLLAYVWVEHLGRPASNLAKVMGQTRASVSWAARQGAKDAQRWNRLFTPWCR